MGRVCVADFGLAQVHRGIDEVSTAQGGEDPNARPESMRNDLKRPTVRERAVASFTVA